MNLLDPAVELSPLARTIRTLRNLGYEIVTIPMIAEEHAKTYKITENDVSRKLCKLHKELRDAYPRFSTMLVTRYYVQNMPNFKRYFGYHIPPRSKSEERAYDLAKLCLSVQWKKSFGMRILDPGTTDFLCRVWEYWWLCGPATGLLASRVRSTSQAAENKHIPAREAATHIVGAALALGPAMNSGKQLPPVLKEVKQLAEETFSGAWEKNFQKSRKGHWRL